MLESAVSAVSSTHRQWYKKIKKLCLYVALHSVTYSAGKSIRDERFFLIVKEMSNIQRHFLLTHLYGKEKMHFIGDFSFAH